MKFKILLLVTPLLSFSISLFANPVVDSIGVENLNGKKVIVHKLDPKDNYYSIGRRYNISPKAIIQFNNNAPLKIGGIVKVPTELPFSGETATAPAVQSAKQVATTPAVQQPQNKIVTQAAVQQNKQQVQSPVSSPAPVAQTAVARPQQAPADTVKKVSMLNVQQYKVSAGETLFSIAKRFNTSVDDIKSLNKLSSDSLAPNQVINVRTGLPPEEAKEPVMQRDSTSVAAQQDTTGGDHGKANRFGLYEKIEKGVATWMDDASLDPKKELVLHRTAPIGTIIKITNPMNNHTTFAKVVGRFTDNETNKNVLIIMTKNTADALGALDKRFQVNISYGSPNE
ncbi:LysM peptidoglycan-binding domain-containing protein [Mucilaginibacter sp. SMC90]|uniref:DPBB and LysM peptidoglycan-binding domain-containing protein n=1 Tax=Mucilaginibacter sp. SMC90 TaxID=2929803 RepID=UPI001FB1EB9E|nr:LysM peptidoglycan-binding domain-containing protein [Mucilaginibacter sp. SMC90]UOE47112.1 LysM peptidoglycan-binding domain-containing protein [Mucilaginibacter sp. SMC90]